MAGYRVSPRATVDLDEIYEYSILKFGLPQAKAHLNGLHGLFAFLEDRPALGRRAANLAPDLRRWEYQSHVIFYVPEPQGILVVRVLHGRMDFQRHFDEPEES